jgi:hypothetical protein
MARDVLFVDVNASGLANDILFREMGYSFDISESAVEASELLESEKYKVLMIEPFVSGVPVNPDAPMVGVIRKAREKRVSVILSTTGYGSDTLSAWGLVRDRDYHAIFERPYSLLDKKADLAEIIGEPF